MVKFADKRFYTHPGSGVRPVYDLVLSPSTRALELVETGKENFQDYIESFRDSTDISIIMRRVNNGEVSLLDVQHGIFGDFTTAPTNYQDVLQAGLDAQNAFNSLPADIRSNFDDLSDFTGSAGSMEWLRKLGVDVSAPDKDESEVSEQ